MKRLIIAVFIALAGCAGTPINWDEARKLKAGMTETEVTAIMGPPMMVRSQAGGMVWVWSHVNGLTASSNVVSVVLRDGKVVEAPVIPSSFK